MLPPFRPLSSPPTRAHTYSEEPPSMLDHRAKRMRVANFGQGSPMPGSPHGLPNETLFASDARSIVSNVPSPNLDFLVPYSLYQSSPLTPGSSIASSEEQLRNGSRSTITPLHQYNATLAQDPPDVRRLSVASLINDPDEESKPVYRSSIRQYPITNNPERTTTYGYDLGRRDFDTPRNNDADAIMIVSPSVSHEDTCNDDPSFPVNDFAAEFGQRSRDMAFEPGGYYAKPVAIKIPQDLEPLPPQLLENGMNLLYFHHFLNHTARILVPHDCDMNPFRMVLPQMALKDPDLLNLLLAYSASHRARLLNHPEPANRIAMWVKDLFPKLRRALMGTDPVTIEALATAIMLASLEILSPNAFEVNISWRDHLSIARQMTIARGGPRPLHREDKVSYFLSRWFAYLDVMGSLSGRKIDKPLSSNYWADDDDNDEGDFQIDCLMGFTTRCVKILARVAELAKQVEVDRLDANGHVQDSWRPQSNIVARAEQLKHDLREAREHVYKPCPYRSPADSANEIGWDSLEIIACNDMFHWAGLIQIDRRILNIPLEDMEVQTAVREIVGALYKIRPGSTAEANILFPLFTAGCHARDPGQRERIMERLNSVESFGMTHMGKAGRLMRRVWDSGEAWESLVSDEFVG
ncbi:C6 zinc finger domain-containing protein [Venturia nashicola]|uniref:C6 zinc finger domain-containing protein n=1 Tax=Venturia nashicola TaxID=86259 RepID=A0A4Z1PV72_9PEZI|nr:C6 zinc finger domain-containing protein [Venturia nashicola]